MTAQVEATSTVYVLDDDAYVRQGLENLLQSLGLKVATFSSVAEFLNSVGPGAPGWT
jgi:two-component system, LuxR family, response regulator FixJ